MSRTNSRTNSIDISKSRTNSWDYRRSNSFGSSSSISSSISIETNEYELDNSPITTNMDLLKIKPKSMKIITNDADKKKRTRDVYINIDDPYKEPTPTPMSYLAKFMKTDLVWIKSKGKYEK